MTSSLKNAPRWRKLRFVATHPGTLLAPARYLFVLSHMRSRSTALTHVLGSHAEVYGYTELHRSYDTPTSLLGMRIDLRSDIGGSFAGCYLLDKVLHDLHVVPVELLARPDVRTLFLLREPVGTLASIVHMARTRRLRSFNDGPAALDYYCGRLATLERLARALDGRFFHLSADDLVDRTEPTLAALSSWLGLRTPLVNAYRTFAHTGAGARGDSSAMIQRGHLAPTAGAPPLDLSDGLLARAMAAWQGCDAALRGKGRSSQFDAPSAANEFGGQG